MNETSLGRVLAVDIRADRIGYAAFDTPKRLLDFGTSRFNSGESGRVRTEFLVRAVAPSVVVLRKPRTRSTRKRPRWNLNRMVIERETRRFGVPIVFIAERTQKRLFVGLHCRNKFQVAELLGTWFPEIARHVPRARKCYEPEPWAMACFDAVALGVAYFILVSDNEPENGVLSSASK